VEIMAATEATAVAEELRQADEAGMEVMAATEDNQPVAMVAMAAEAHMLIPGVEAEVAIDTKRGNL